MHETRSYLSDPRASHAIHRAYAAPLPVVARLEPAIEAPTSKAAHALLAGIVGSSQRRNVRHVERIVDARRMERMSQLGKR